MDAVVTELKDFLRAVTKLPELVAAWFTEEDKKLLVRACKARQERYSDFLRRSVLKELASLSLLEPERAKALGVASK